MGHRLALCPHQGDPPTSRLTTFFPQLYRHGDRSPVKTYPKDPHQEDKWPQGFGQLTKVGQEPALSGCAVEPVTSRAGCRTHQTALPHVGADFGHNSSAYFHPCLD